MKTHVQKWGNSLALRIPKSLADTVGLDEGAEVEVTLDDNRLIIQSTMPHFTLEELLSQITPENVHDEIDTSAPVGNEVW